MQEDVLEVLFAGADRAHLVGRSGLHHTVGGPLESNGHGSSLALVFVALLATDGGGLTADELAAQLQVSRAAISGAVNYLGHVGLTTRERQPGTRRQRYVLQNPTWYEVIARREQILDRWIATTREGVNAVGPTTPAGRRLAESLAFFEFLSTELHELLGRWREHRADDHLHVDR